MTIEIDIQAPFQDLVEAELLEQAVQCVLTAERAQGDVTVVITDDDAVAALNQQFLGKEGPTDVLSFPATEEEPGFELPEEAASYLGDILIALPFTQRQARRVQRPLAHELALLVVHGTLHLLGYDHATPEEKGEMWAKQNAILTGLGLEPLDD